MASGGDMYAPSAPPAASPSAAAAPAHGGYEVILSAAGSVVEAAPGTARASGALQCIQGAVSENAQDGFFAFLSVDDVQVPLVASHTSSRVGAKAFQICIPGHTFVVTLDPRTEQSVVDGMENVLRWFTTWSGSAAPAGDQFGVNAAGGVSDKPVAGLASESLDGETAAAAAATVPPNGSPGGSLDGMSRTRSTVDRAGVKGAVLVTKYGEKLNASIKARADASVAANADRPAKEVKLGGAATAGALGGAKKVVGTGAAIAAMAIDKLASAIGSGLANNKAMRSLRDAPPDSQKRKVHDLLVSGAMAVGRVYIAADNQGKLIFETAGDGAGRVAGAKYGAEAEAATRAVGHIGLDTYRILRFPNKLIASSLVKGAVKGASAAHAQANLGGSAERPRGTDAYGGPDNAGGPSGTTPAGVSITGGSPGNPYASASGKQYSSSAM